MTLKALEHPRSPYPAHAQLPNAVASEVGLLTGAADRPYALGLAAALLAKGVCLDFIGSDDMDSRELRANPQFTFLNLRGNQRPDARLVRKIWRVLVYYARLIRYAWTASPCIFHILWNNKFERFDRTLLTLYYKLLGKKVVLTAHNVNAGRRDSSDSVFNRLTLKIQYRLADHIFVHTEGMKRELLASFRVHGDAITVIPFGINNSVPVTNLSPARARHRLGIGKDERAVLFFGNIAPYKGLEFLVAAFQRLVARDPRYRLIIAGQPTRRNEIYVDRIRQSIHHDLAHGRIIQRMEYIPDHETELYFKAADVLVLPYTQVSQSGVLVLSYGFGLPVIAADVGSLREDVIEGRTGFLCRACDPRSLAATIESYFESDLFRELAIRRPKIRDYAGGRYSWETVSQRTCAVYEELRSSCRSRPVPNNRV
jgi:glycosyltransferase involved in cell wall biosynthesis